MKVIILGSGTAIPLAGRSSPSMALLIENTPLILLDMGPGTLHQLARIGLSHEQINRIFLTHFHPDHTADLIHLFFATRNPSVMERRKPFSITGPTGLNEFVHAFEAAYGHWVSLPPEVMALEELSLKEKSKKGYGTFSITTSHTLHTQNSLAYRVETATGKSVVYSGDTGFCDEIVELARGADLLVLEAAFPEGKEAPGHLTPVSAGHIASLAGVKRLVLTHFYPECLATDIASQCRSTYSGELTIGEDLLHIAV